MKNLQEESLELRSDINKVIEAINKEVDCYIGSFTSPNKYKRKLLREVFFERKKKTKALARKMYKKYE